MSLNPIQEAILAYFIAGQANDLNIATRWYPRGELLLIVDDKFQMAVRKFGVRVRGATKPAADAFLQSMIDKGGWETKPQEYGSMHQFNHAAFRAALKDMQASNPLVAEAAAGGEDFWKDTFAALTAA
ncbi:MAG: hypothetical protein KGM17_02015 [Sphingomonadales bacterium]|nr:hypothetical protein [Sphingomonadales bacterium]